MKTYYTIGHHMGVVVRLGSDLTDEKGINDRITFELWNNPLPDEYEEDYRTDSDDDADRWFAECGYPDSMCEDDTERLSDGGDFYGDVTVIVQEEHTVDDDGNEISCKLIDLKHTEYVYYGEEG